MQTLIKLSDNEIYNIPANTIIRRSEDGKTVWLNPYTDVGKFIGVAAQRVWERLSESAEQQTTAIFNQSFYLNK